MNYSFIVILKEQKEIVEVEAENENSAKEKAIRKFFNNLQMIPELKHSKRKRVIGS